MDSSERDALRKKFRQKHEEQVRKKKQKKIVTFTLGITLVICLVLLSQAFKINKSNSQKREEYQSLQVEATKESKKGDELEESKKYVKSNDYIESIARERLNLSKKGEIIVQPKEN